MDTLFQNVLTASFHGGIVILAVLLLRLALKKAPKKFICLLWLLAGIRLLMPFEIKSDLSLQPEPTPIAQVQTQTEGMLLFPDSGLPAVEVIPFDEETPAPQIQAQPITPAAPAEAPVQPVTAEPEKEPFDFLALIPYIWLTVALGFGVVSVVSYLRLKRQVRFAIKIPGGWECDTIDTAFILGFIRPKIYIPMGMSRSNRKYILAHERTHLDKGDHWIKMIGYIALAIHWFNPLVWAAYILLCKDIEMACDERVVQFMELEERKAYSAALLSCSANRAHFAACPVAFGEVSVKERIKSVLNYRKPGFWVSLLSVAAIFFVAVCLLTSPADGEEAPTAGETTPTTSVDETIPAKENGFASTLSESEVIYTCEQALEALKALDSYYIQRTLTQTSTSEHYGTATSGSAIRRHGENLLVQDMENGQLIAGGGELRWEGNYGVFMGDKWAWEGTIGENSREVNYWLDAYSPQGKVYSLPQIVSGDTVSFHAGWTEENPFPRQYSGTFTFTFNDDGTLLSASREYTYSVSEEDGGGEVRYVQTFTVMEEPAEDTLAHIEAVAAEALTMEELEEYRLMQEIVTEVPSNKTQYDKNFMLGSGQMGWKFMKGEWFFKFGAVDVTTTSARILIEYNGSYGDGTITGGTVKSGPEYFIEELVDGVWTTVEPTAASFSTIPEVNLSVGASQTINWENNYGALPAGFYRIGNYYTFTAANGETDTQVCYAKFRLYDPEMEELLNKCKNGLANLLASDSYHVLATSHRNISTHSQSEIGRATDEIWKSGSNYLLDSCSYYQTDDTAAWGNGLMRRGGIYYDLEWIGFSSRNAVTSWETVTYPDEDNFQIWSWTYKHFDANVYEITQEGNTIRVLELDDYYEDIPYTETVYIFDDAGNLKSISKAYIYDNGDREITDEMVVFDSTKADVKAFIDSQDLSKLPAFSWVEDSALYNPDEYEVRTKNFVNSTAKRINSTQDVIDIAILDCTLSAAFGMEPGTNVSKVFYDAEAQMWKVEFTASWDSTIYQAVYLNAQGMTHMTVTLELEPAF